MKEKGKAPNPRNTAFVKAGAQPPQQRPFAGQLRDERSAQGNCRSHRGKASLARRQSCSKPGRGLYLPRAGARVQVEEARPRSYDSLSSTAGPPVRSLPSAPRKDQCIPPHLTPAEQPQHNAKATCLRKKNTHRNSHQSHFRPGAPPVPATQSDLRMRTSCAGRGARRWARHRAEQACALRRVECVFLIGCTVRGGDGGSSRKGGRNKVFS